MPHRTAQELPVVHSRVDDLRPLLNHFGGDGTIGRIMIFTAEPYVVDPNGVRRSGIEVTQFADGVGAVRAERDTVYIADLWWPIGF
jgi:hypothetical protein